MKEAVTKYLVLLALAACATSHEVANCNDCPETENQTCGYVTWCYCGGIYNLTGTLDCGQQCSMGATTLCVDQETLTFLGSDFSYKPTNNTDICDYGPAENCEGQCSMADEDCFCGEEEFNIRDSQTFCCNGKQQSIRQPCQSSDALRNAPSASACYNSYQNSEYIGYSAHLRSVTKISEYQE